MKKIKIFLHRYDNPPFVMERIQYSTKSAKQAMYYLHVKKIENKFLDENEIKALQNYTIWLTTFLTNNFDVFKRGLEKDQKRHFHYFEQILAAAVEYSEYYHWFEFIDYKMLNRSAIVKWQGSELMGTRSPTLAVIRGNEFAYY